MGTARVKRVKKTLGILFASSALALVAACGSDASPDTTTSGAAVDEAVEKPTSAPAELAEDDLVDRLSAAQLAAGTAHVRMDQSVMGMEMAVRGEIVLADRPEDVRARVRMDVNGMEMDTRIVDGVMYLGMGQMTDGKFIKVDPSDPDDPFAEQYGSLTEQMDPGEQLEMFRDALVSFENLGDGGELDGVPTTRLRLALKTEEVLKGRQGDLDAAQLPEQIEYQMWVGDDDLIRKIEMDLFDTPMTVTYSKWGEPVEVEAPAPSELIELSELGASAFAR